MQRTQNKKNEILLCTHGKCEKPQTESGEYCDKHYPEEITNESMIKKSVKLQNKLLSLIGKKNKKVASDMLYEIIELELEIEQRCNR